MGEFVNNEVWIDNGEENPIQMEEDGQTWKKRKSGWMVS